MRININDAFKNTDVDVNRKLSNIMLSRFRKGEEIHQKELSGEQANDDEESNALIGVSPTTSIRIPIQKRRIESSPVYRVNTSLVSSKLERKQSNIKNFISESRILDNELDSALSLLKYNNKNEFYGSSMLLSKFLPRNFIFGGALDPNINNVFDEADKDELMNKSIDEIKTLRDEFESYTKDRANKSKSLDNVKKNLSYLNNYLDSYRKHVYRGADTSRLQQENIVNVKIEYNELVKKLGGRRVKNLGTRRAFLENKSYLEYLIANLEGRPEEKEEDPYHMDEYKDEEEEEYHHPVHQYEDEDEYEEQYHPKEEDYEVTDAIQTLIDYNYYPKLENSDIRYMDTVEKLKEGFIERYEAYEYLLQSTHDYSSHDYETGKVDEELKSCLDDLEIILKLLVPKLDENQLKVFLKDLDIPIDINRNESKGSSHKLNKISVENIIDSIGNINTNKKSHKNIRIVNSIDVKDFSSELLMAIKKISNMVTVTLLPIAQKLSTSHFEGISAPDKNTIISLYEEMDDKMYMLTSLNNMNNAQLIKLDKAFDELYNLVKNGLYTNTAGGSMYEKYNFPWYYL